MPDQEGFGRPVDFPEWLFPGVYSQNKITGRLSWVQALTYDMGERMVYDLMVQYRDIHWDEKNRRLSVSRESTTVTWLRFIQDHQRVWDKKQFHPKDLTLWLGLPEEPGPHPPVEESSPLRFNRAWPL